MDIPKLQLVSILVLITLASTTAAAQENAIGGQVRLRGSEKGLGHAKVTVAQKPEINNTTDDKDGVYVLLVPKALKKFDLIYEHDNCFRLADEEIPNEQAQHKRPFRELRSNSVAAVRALTPEELNEIVTRANDMTLKGLQTNTLPLLEAGQTNLRILATTAETIGKEATEEAKKGDVAKAEKSYKTALAILEKTTPASYQFARMLDEYAAFLRKTGRSELAKEQAAKANDIRSQAQFFQGIKPFAPYESKAYASKLIDSWFESNLIGNTARYDKFALEHLDSLPNLVGTITLLSETDGQFGHVSVPGGGSASFRVHLEDNRVPFLRILTKTELPYEIEVTGDKGRIEPTQFGNLITWSTGSSRTFTVTIINKDPHKQDYVVNLSAWVPKSTSER